MSETADDVLAKVAVDLTTFINAMNLAGEDGWPELERRLVAVGSMELPPRPRRTREAKRALFALRYGGPVTPLPDRPRIWET